MTEEQTQVQKGQDTAETFRDRISTVTEEGKRSWIYPKKPKGKFYNARTWVSVFLLILLFGGPFIRIDGEPLLLLNVLERKFVIFGQVFWPQDFFLFGLGMIAMVIFVALFTVVYGRVFCGWVCPQTIFMEMVFRKIEYWIEGDYKHQMRLDKMEWNAEKIRKKTLKHAIFFGISFLIANTFLAYIIGSEELISIVTDPPAEHIGGLIGIVAFTGAFYGVFAFFREQVCTNVCPYGRLQGVMLDRDSIVVAYDHVRGEPRGRFKKNEDREKTGKGDCIECFQCVDVCPTGIDIRNGTQLECVNCTACIDACDHMMESVGLPKGLIRYDSEAAIADEKKFRFTGRMKAYTAVLVLLVGVLVGLLVTRSDVETTILRTPGMLYQEQENNQVSNLYNVKLINKTNKEFPVRFEILKGEGKIKMVGDEILQVDKQDIAEGALFIYMDKQDIVEMKTSLTIGVYSGDKLLEKVKTNFIGPVQTAGKTE